MTAMKLIDNLDSSVCYGVLLCHNDGIAKNEIQDKIYEIKSKLSEKSEEWIVNDVINDFPQDWKISFQEQFGQVEI